MLLENCRGGEGALEAVRAPVPHHTSKSPQRFSTLLPVIRQVTKKGLDLARSPVFLNDGPLLGMKSLARRCHRSFQDASLLSLVMTHVGADKVKVQEPSLLIQNASGLASASRLCLNLWSQAPQ